MVNFIENEEKSDTSNATKHNKVKESKSEMIHNQIKGMKGVVKTLENSLTESHLEQRHLLIQMHIDDIKNHNVTSQLDEARKENKQLLNILQQKCHESEGPRSQIDASPAYSTMSVVNLQYKYEELLAKYQGLLKVMISRDKDIQRCHKENESIMEDMNNTHRKLRECEQTLKRVCEKYMALKQRRNNKENMGKFISNQNINQLKNEKETLRLAHNQVVMLLHQQCMKSEDLITEQLHNISRPERALLLQEVQRSNKLHHENILLRQEIACLRSKCKFPNLPTRKSVHLEENSKCNT